MLVLLLLAFGWQHDLFHTTRWYDIFMHLTGGGFLTVTFAGTAWHAGLKNLPPRLFKPLLFAGVLLTAVAWEVFEVPAGLHPNWTTSVWDTATDLIYSLTGCLAALRLIRNN